MSVLTRYEIRPNGRLFRLTWENQVEVPYDVTEHAPRLLFEDCTLAEGVTLRDVFLLMRQHLDFFDTLFGNWCKEIVTEGLSPVPDGPIEQGNIDYLELSWRMEVNAHWERGKGTTKKSFINGHAFPDFHGVGIPKNDEFYGGADKRPENPEPVTWAVEMTPTNKLVDLPLVLKDEFVIMDMQAHAQSFKAKEGRHWKEFETTYDHTVFNLFHILYGIIWELSFFGGPAERDEVREDLDRRIEDIDDETEWIPMEEVIASLREKFSDRESEE